MSARSDLSPEDIDQLVWAMKMSYRRPIERLQQPKCLFTFCALYEGSVGDWITEFCYQTAITDERGEIIKPVATGFFRFEIDGMYEMFAELWNRVRGFIPSEVKQTIIDSLFGEDDMGWASGSELAEDVWAAVRPYVVEEHRRDLAREIMSLFEDHDCDTLYECDLLMADAKVDLE